MLRAVHLHLWANDGDSWENLYLIPIVYTHGNTLQWRSSVCLHGYSHACSRNMNYCTMKFACFLVENRISCACSRVPNGSCFNTDWERCMVYHGKRRHNNRRNTQMGRRRRDHRERQTPQRAYVFVKRPRLLRASALFHMLSRTVELYELLMWCSFSWPCADWLN